jgi:branched-subunit amino acid ABC-type transport system permease component
VGALRKILLYSVVAVVLGLLLILIPLITLADIRTEKDFQYGPPSYLESLPEQLRKLEGASNGLNKPAYSTADLQILVISFAIALVVYLLFKRRIA